MYFMTNIYIALSRDKNLTSDHANHFDSILMILFRHDSFGILEFADDLNYLRLIEPLNYFGTHYWRFRQTYFFEKN